MSQKKMKKTKYVQIGLGSRHVPFRDAITKDYSYCCEMVGLCDNNPGRLKLAIDTVLNETGNKITGYAADDFEKMLSDTEPDFVIVTMIDSLHDYYVCRAMELGYDVICEKPMTTDEKKCQRIVDTKKSTGRKCIVTFNCRYSPPRTQVKDLLMSGVIGNILSVDFHWMLDTTHGADYYRRWHRNKMNSGGLLVHKSTHHFDLINWWLSDIPETVYAAGCRSFYTPETADRLELKNRSERCLDCQEKFKCSFYLDLASNEGDELLKDMYLECEKYDGYHRDMCVFSKDIDIEDTMSVAIDFAKGTKLSYSLNSYCAWEGYTVVFNGTKGRLEHTCQETVYISGDGSVPGELKPDGTTIKIFPLESTPYEITPWKAEGGHGGADPIMVKELFDREKKTENVAAHDNTLNNAVSALNNNKDKYLRAADYRSGAYSILCGIAANISIKEKRPVNIDSLISGLDMPDYPDMPDASTKL
jgi:predicted dehydrogenase